MTVTLGDTTLPGVKTTVESSNSVAVSVGSPGDVGLVGGADLENGNASVNTVYKITTPVGARNKFGADSELTTAVVDALGMGTYPVHAVAPDTTSVTEEDISGIGGSSGTLSNGPVTEDPSETTFTVDGTVLNTVIVWGDPATMSPASDEVYLNPVTVEFELGSTNDDADDTNDTVDYTHYDYSSAITTMEEEEGDVVDFFSTVSENTNVVDSLQSALGRMEDNYNFALGVAGAGTYVDTTNYSNPYDDSRMQLFHPTRTSDGDTIIGKVVGLRAALGANGSIMRKRLQGDIDLNITLSKIEKEELDAENVVPIANESSGARIITDATSKDTGNMQDGLSRIIVDYVTDIVHTTSDAFIGELNIQSKRNAMRSQIISQLLGLVEQNSVEEFTVIVEEDDAYTAGVEVSVETVKPLRNIVANLSAGEIEG